MSGDPVTDAPKPSDEQEAPAPERPPEEGPSTDTSDEPEGG